MAQQIESECDCDWPEGKGLGVCKDLIPDQATGLSAAVQQRVLERFYVGSGQYREKDEYFVTGRPVHDFETYLRKIERHLMQAMQDYVGGTSPTEDNLAAVADNAILAMQHQERKTDRPKTEPKTESNNA